MFNIFFTKENKQTSVQSEEQDKLPPIEIVEVDTTIIDEAISELANPTEVDILKDELLSANDKIESLQIKLWVAITERDEWKLKYLNK